MPGDFRDFEVTRLLCATTSRYTKLRHQTRSSLHLCHLSCIQIWVLLFQFEQIRIRYTVISLMRFVRTTARYIFLSCHTDVLHTPSLSDRPIRFHYSVPFARVCPSSLHHIFKARGFAPPERIIFSSIALRSYRSFCTFSFLSHICFYGLPCPCRLHVVFCSSLRSKNNVKPIWKYGL